MDIAKPQCLGLCPYGFGDNGLIRDRSGIGHGKHRGKPALGRGLGTGLDGLGILAAWLAQVHVHINQARQQHVAAAVDGLGAVCLHLGPDGVNNATADEDVGGLAFPVQANIFNQ